MAQTKVKLVSNGVITVDNLHTNHGITTDHIGEGSVLYYTDARVQSFLTTNNYITNSDVANLETVTSLSLAANTLTYTDESGGTTNIDLSPYLDYTASSWFNTTNNSSDWDTAYSWGDHAGLYSLLGHSHTESDITDFGNYVTSITHDTVNTKLVVTNRDATTTDLSLTQYLDDTNLARLVSGSLDGGTGVATFTRDDSSTFTVDFSAFLSDANDYVSSASFNTSDGVLTLTRFGGGTVTVDLDNRYLTSFTETDPIYTASSWYTTTNNSSNWDTAYGWGDHASAGYAAASSLSDYLPLAGGSISGNLHLAKTSIITFYGNASADHSISSRGIDWTETDDIRINSYGSVFVNLDSNNNNTNLADFIIGRHGGEETINSILLTLNGENGDLTISGDVNASGGNSGQWNTAYGWGNHASAGYLTSLPWNDNDAFTGTYPIVWTSSNELYRTSWLQVRGSDDSLLTRSIIADGNISANKITIGNKFVIDPTGWSDADADQWPYFYWQRNGSTWDEGLIKASSSRGFFGKAGWGIHMHSSRAFHIFSSGWTTNFGVDHGGTAIAAESFRAPIFYDSNDTNYYVDTNSTTRLAGLKANSIYNDNASTTVGAAGWYTIATNSGSRAFGTFIITDYTGGKHQTVKFTASHHYGAGNAIIVTHNDYYSGSPIRYIRIKEGSTYDGAMLQVYYDTTSATSVYLNDNFQGSGWAIKNYIPDGTDPGNLGNFSALTNVAVQVDVDQAGRGGITASGSVIGLSSVRGPIFYDYDDTGRYFDGSSTGDSIRVSGDIIAYYSDERLKDIKGNIENPIEKIKQLNGFYYTPNETAQKLGYKEKEQVGLSAQEVEKVLPQIIKDAAIGKGYKTLDYSKVVPLLVEAIKEQQQQIEELKALINK